MCGGEGGGGGGNGASAHLGYSSDNSSWHEDLAVGDLYIRFSVATSRPAEDSNIWTPGRRFVGEDGAPGVGTPGPPGQGVPTGGTDMQVLAKASVTDYDTAWVD